MSTSAAPSTPTPAGRASSSSRREFASAQADTPSRSQSVAHRNSNPASPAPARSNSTNQPGSRPPSSSRQAHLAGVARRDWEQTSLSRPPSSSHRSTSADRHPSERQTHASQSSPRSPGRSSSRGPHSRHASTAPADGPAHTDAPAQASQPNGRHPSQQQVAAPPPPGQPQRRTTVTAQTGTWTLGKTIGAGSMGKVKLARNLDTNEQAAIKIVPRYSNEEHRTPQDRERADRSKEIRTQREAAIVTLVSHPYICGMRDVLRTNYHWYMLFEYVNGGQMLDYIISHGRLKEKQARKFGRQIASALDYCHRNSIVHRDLKIENILISKTGDIKIIDFGLSNLFSPRSQLKTFCGSLYFAAPELLQARQYTGPEVDVWSFGIVLYVLVCGKVPFDDQSMPQLHAKIKKGAVEYPPWLTPDCRDIISKMLVTDPKRRAPLSEVMSHPWMTKGFGGPPENFLPHREPLQLPLDAKIIDKMTGFEFGSAEYIRDQLESVIQSDEYQRAIRLSQKKISTHSSDGHSKRSSVFDFYQRRKSNNSKDALGNPSSEALHLGEDPVNAFSPLISIYYLVREKQERERQESNPGALSIPGDQPLAMPDLPAPKAAVTNSSSFEMKGEAPTGGRARPRARTQGEDEMVDATKQLPKPVQQQQQQQQQPTPVVHEPSTRTNQLKKEGTAAGLLRRFSTRRNRDGESKDEKPKASGAARPPSLAVQSAPEGAGSLPRQSLTIRKQRDTPPSAYREVAEKHPDLLAPPASSDGGPTRKLKGLGRSASVNSGDLRRRWSLRRGPSDASEVAKASGYESEKSSISDYRSRHSEGPLEEREPQSKRLSFMGGRTRSVDHSRRQSVQNRHSIRVERARNREDDLPEETDAELAEEEPGALHGAESRAALKPIYFKGLFSVSTTSSKPLPVIRADILRVLKQLGVDFTERRSGFYCKHVPSIDLERVKDQEGREGNAVERQSSHTHRRKISFAGLRNSEREAERPQGTPRSSYRRTGAADTDHENSAGDESEDENADRRSRAQDRAPGETTTHVQSDLGQSMILKFEIVIVKIPIVSLHGIQFKKVDGGTWQYKRMAETILGELKL